MGILALLDEGRRILGESTGYECRIVEFPKGRWYYVLENRFGDDEETADDWLDEATVRGPYDSSDAAITGLHRHEANPGGYSILSAEDTARRASRWKAIVARAERP